MGNETVFQNISTNPSSTTWPTVASGPMTTLVKCGTTAHQANVTSRSLWLKSGDTVAGATSQLWDEVPDQSWTNSIMPVTSCPGVTGALLWMVNKPTQPTSAMLPPKTSTSTSDGIWPLWA